jgi:hypothetical protein
VRREAARALGLLNDHRAAPALITTLRDTDVNVRLYSAFALGEIKDAQALDALLAALADPEWCVRDQAAWALREIRDPRIVKPLVTSLSVPDRDIEPVRWILRDLDRQLVLEALSDLLQSADARARLRAVGVLHELRESQAFDVLITALGDSSAEVRRSAVVALTELADDRAEPALRQLLRSETDADVRRALEDAVRRFSGLDDLVAHWSFDDGDVARAIDQTGRGNDGQMRHCVPAEGKVGQALRFSHNSCIEFGRPAGLPIAGVPFTVMAWINTDAEDGVVVARGGAYCGYSLYVKEGIPKFGIQRIQDEPTYIAAASEPLPSGWVHLSGIVKEDRIELYVNGKPAATAETPGFIPGNCGQGMEIGFDVGNSPAEITDHFVGLIDEVKIFQAALSPAEIARQCGGNP